MFRSACPSSYSTAYSVNFELPFWGSALQVVQKMSGWYDGHPPPLPTVVSGPWLIAGGGPIPASNLPWKSVARKMSGFELPVMTTSRKDPAN